MEKNNVIDFIKDLDEKGYAVIPGVLSPEKCKQYIEDFWKWVDSYSASFYALQIDLSSS